MTNRVLWALAFFASFLGIAPTFETILELTPSQGSLSYSAATAVISGDFLTSNFFDWSVSFSQIPWASLTIYHLPILTLLLLMLTLIILLVVVVISSEGGLIKAADYYLKDRKLSYLEAFRHGLDKFWEIFILHFIFRLIYLVIFAALLVPLAVSAYSFGPGLTLASQLAVFFILAPTLIVLDIVVRYSIMYVMLEKRPVLQAFDKGWKLFKQNWLISLETAILIFLVLAVFIFALILILSLLAVIVVLLATQLPPASLALQLLLMIALVMTLALVALAMMIFTSFYLTIWVNIFRRLGREPHYSKIHRSVGHLPILHKKII